MRRVAVVTCLTLGACFNPDLGDQPFRCGPSNACPPGYDCVSQICTRTGSGDGGTHGDGGGGICTAGCSGDVLTTCNGAQPVMTTCASGCDDTQSAPACWVLTPSNIDGSICDQTGASPLRVALARSLVADSCAIEGGTLANQPVGPQLCVFVYSDITIDAHATLSLSGIGVVPVLVATGTVTVHGTIDLSATAEKGGAGSDPKNTLGRGAVAARNTGNGGGGGGCGTAGGGGGIENGATPTPGGIGLGGASLSPIFPGGFGGAGGRPCIDTCPVGPSDSGGGGGGAVQIVACQGLVIGADAVINANGGGGNGGVVAVATSPAGGGDGGGAGGSILIEAPAIDIPAGATLVANGGGGGGGAVKTNATTSLAGGNGDDGHVAADAANGGDPGGGGAGSGGDGGALGHSVKDGGGGDAAGGGGGAVGRIRLNARADQPPTVADKAVLSPMPSTGTILRHH